MVSRQVLSIIISLHLLHPLGDVAVIQTNFPSYSNLMENYDFFHPDHNWYKIMNTKDSYNAMEGAKICSNLTSRIEFEWIGFPIQFELWEKLIWI